ncbi:MAG: energy transducer TonB [Gammaproteobacteria bacterium]
MRLALSLIGGVIAAFGLFLLMNSLIDSGDAKIANSDDTSIIDFVRLTEDTRVQTKDRKKPKKPPPPKKRPPPPKMTVNKTDKPPPQRLNIVTPNIKVPVSAGGGPYLGGFSAGQANAEGDVIPIVRIAPQYPREARLKGTEGWVKVRFTIMEDGTVSAPSVIDAQPRRTFNREAIRAILRWKFKPRIIDGVATKREAEQTIEFTMDGS